MKLWSEEDASRMCTVERMERSRTKYPTPTLLQLGKSSSPPQLNSVEEREAFVQKSDTSHEEESVVLSCASIQDWLGTKDARCKGFLVVRPELHTPCVKLQPRVDKLHASDNRYANIELHNLHPEEVEDEIRKAANQLVSASGVGDPRYANGLNPPPASSAVASEGATRPVAAGMGHLLEEEDALREQILRDAVDIATAMAKLLPQATQAEMKLETFGSAAGVCTQWHRDRYLARSIVTYVGNAGTEWAEDGGVSLWHLQRGGTNAQRVAGDGWVRSAKVGDVLLIKGMQYPTPSSSILEAVLARSGIGPASNGRGLVHKSPEPSFHADASVVRRLCLKVDFV